jgi:hypothetical protein
MCNNYYSLCCFMLMLFLFVLTLPQPTNNLSSQEFSMRHQETGRFTCKFSDEVKLKIIQWGLK